MVLKRLSVIEGIIGLEPWPRDRTVGPRIGNLLIAIIAKFNGGRPINAGWIEALAPHRLGQKINQVIRRVLSPFPDVVVIINENGRPWRRRRDELHKTLRLIEMEDMPGLGCARNVAIINAIHRK